VPDMQRAIESYQGIFGYQLLSGPFDDPIQNVSVCFLGQPGSQQVEIELVSPLGAASPIRSLLAKGGGAYHVCYEVPDLEQALKEAREQGCLLLGAPVPAVAFGGRRIAWCYTPTRQLFEVVEGGGSKC